MRRHGFAWDIPMQYAMYLSTPPALREVYPTPDFFGEMAGNRMILDAWRGELSDFARVSGFLDWEKERAPLREAELAAVRASTGGADLSAELVAELGVKTWASWTVAVGPFFARGGGGAWVIEEKPGRPDIVVMYGPKYAPEPVPDTPERFAAGVTPEVIFSLAYAILESCRPHMILTMAVCEGLPNLRNPEDCAEQLWVRGIVGRLVERRYGRKGVEEYLESWSRSPYQAKVSAALGEYEKNRARYKDLMDARGILAAPFQPDGRAPECVVSDPTRWGEKIYARRLVYYLEARLEAHPDPELKKTLVDLKAYRASEGP
jgi:hypothetical protein